MSGASQAVQSEVKVTQPTKNGRAGNASAGNSNIISFFKWNETLRDGYSYGFLKSSWSWPSTSCNLLHFNIGEQKHVKILFSRSALVITTVVSWRNRQIRRTSKVMTRNVISIKQIVLPGSYVYSTLQNIWGWGAWQTPCSVVFCAALWEKITILVLVPGIQHRHHHIIKW